MSVNSLGSFTFIRMDADGQPDGTPPTLSKESTIINRPGVPGSGVIDMATRGREFQLNTVVDVATLMAAETLKRNYAASAVEDPVDLVRAGINYTLVHDCRYIIMRFIGARISQAANSVGGLNGGRYLVIASFTLLPVPVS